MKIYPETQDQIWDHIYLFIFTIQQLNQFMNWNFFNIVFMKIQVGRDCMVLDGGEGEGGWFLTSREESTETFHVATLFPA